ncbi:DUF397 domain-containing protein [Streptosporangium sp. NPDC002721]|uniref:DUF397 domain-containing protein n=1 Tax=Streptosporangium sp. NPDC002721 TaxID=3366188 RepID=UPI0036A69FAC
MSHEEIPRAVWRKSSLSGGNGGSCVEVASLNGGRVGVRDSKDRSGPALIFTSTEWQTFVSGIKGGSLADPAA